LHELHKNDGAKTSKKGGESGGGEMKYAERPESAVIAKEAGPKKLAEFIEAASARARAEGIPLSPDGRVDMSAYRAHYGDEVDEDLRDTREGRTDAKEVLQERLKTDGEKLEMLIYVVLQKGLGSRFIVARSSPHDDKHHGVDTIIFEKATGNLVCAFDEVSDMTGVEYLKKRATVLKHNTKDGGAIIKYAFELQEVEGVKTIVPGKAANIPLFYVALERNWIEKGIREFNPAPDERSDFERKLFEYMIGTIELQIRALEFDIDTETPLKPELLKRLQDFKKVIEALKGNPGRS
jgi:hypothetical protein